MFGIAYIALGLLMLIVCWAVRRSYVGSILILLCAFYCFIQAAAIL